MTHSIEFTKLCQHLKHRLAQALPGHQAHDTFRAKSVGDVRPRFNHQGPPRPGAVLILLYEDEASIKYPLIKRPEYIGTHGGQISLPGGKAEPGEDAIQTALRECEEEIGITKETLTVLGKLSDFFVIPSNYIVTPIISYTLSRPVFKPDPYEVSKIFEARIDHLIAEDAVKEKEILAAGKYRMMAPHFEVEQEVVWGATAMMLNEFRVILKDIIWSGKTGNYP